MSSVSICDGCGKSIEVPIVLGRSTPRDYCEDCASKAKQFMDAEDELRKNMHERFVDDRALLIANLSVENFKLPDVPDDVPDA